NPARWARRRARRASPERPFATRPRARVSPPGRSPPPPPASVARARRPRPPPPPPAPPAPVRTLPTAPPAPLPPAPRPPPRVPHHLPFETGEILALRRPARAEQLRERVLARELVPVAVVLDPEVAHHATHGRGQHDDVKRRRERDTREYDGERQSHRFRRA